MPRFTAAAARTLTASSVADDDVLTVAELLRLGCTRSQIAARLAAARWQRLGRAVVTHHGPLTPAQRRRVALINCGPRAALTSFTALQAQGFLGWARDPGEVHVLVVPGDRGRAVPGLHVVRHRRSPWPMDEIVGQTHRAAPAALLAAASLTSTRSACGLVTALVQQRLSTPAHLRTALRADPGLRHRRQLGLTIGDIEMGAQALSEIDFVRVCRRFRLPAPQQQAVRSEKSGRRRYLDATWQRADGREVAVEIDGAVHLSTATWWDDQLRQNHLALAGVIVLRYPSVIVRTEPQLVADQLRQALHL